MYEIVRIIVWGNYEIDEKAVVDLVENGSG